MNKENLISQESFQKIKDHVLKLDRNQSFFEMDEQNAECITLLSLYFMENKEFEKYNSSFSLDKGILLFGEVGTGKTKVMEFFQCFSKFTDNSFLIMPANWVVRDVILDAARINEFGRECYQAKMDEFGKKIPRTYCFDDLGLEYSENKIYGNSMEIMGEILMDRYTMMATVGMKTHATSNLDLKDLKTKYSDRIISRFKEMFNVIAITGKDRRK